MIMEDNITEIILQLKEALTTKYGRHFKKFYLTSNIEETKDWEGLINYTEEGERNVEYYTIKNHTVVKDDKIFH